MPNSTAYRPIGPGPNLGVSTQDIAKAIAQYNRDVSNGVRSPHIRDLTVPDTTSPPLSSSSPKSLSKYLAYAVRVALEGLKMVGIWTTLRSSGVVYKAVHDELSQSRQWAREARPSLEDIQSATSRFFSDSRNIGSSVTDTNLQICRDALTGFWRSAANYLLNLPSGETGPVVHQLLVAIQAILTVGPLEFTHLEHTTMECLEKQMNIEKDLPFDAMLHVSDRDFILRINVRTGLEAEIAEARTSVSASLARLFQHGTITERRAAMYGSVAPNISISRY